MRKKNKYTLLKVFLAVFVIAEIWLVYTTFFESFIPYTKTKFSDYDKFFDAGYNVTMPENQPEYCKNIKYWFKHGLVQEKAFYCNVEKSSDITALADMLEREHGISHPLNKWDPKWFKDYPVKNTHFNFYYMYTTDREEKIPIGNIDIYAEKIRPFVHKLTETDENWYCVSLYEETWSNLVHTFGIMANGQNEVIQFDRYERIETR